MMATGDVISVAVEGFEGGSGDGSEEPFDDELRSSRMAQFETRAGSAFIELNPIYRPQDVAVKTSSAQQRQMPLGQRTGVNPQQKTGRNGYKKLMMEIEQEATRLLGSVTVFKRMKNPKPKNVTGIYLVDSTNLSHSYSLPHTILTSESIRTGSRIHPFTQPENSAELFKSCYMPMGRSYVHEDDVIPSPRYFDQPPPLINANFNAPAPKLTPRLNKQQSANTTYLRAKGATRYARVGNGDVPTEEKSSNMIQVGFKGGALKKQGAYSKIITIPEKKPGVAADVFQQQRRARQYTVQGEVDEQLGTYAEDGDENTGAEGVNDESKEMDNALEVNPGLIAKLDDQLTEELEMTRLTRSQSCGLLSWRSPASRHGPRLRTSQSSHRLAVTSPRVIQPPLSSSTQRADHHHHQQGAQTSSLSSSATRAVHLPFVSVPLPVPFFIKKGLKLGRRLGSSSSSASSSSGDSRARAKETPRQQQQPLQTLTSNVKKRTRKKHEDADSMPPIRIVSTSNSCPRCSKPIGSHPDTGALSSSVDAISRTRMHSVVVCYDSAFDDSYTRKAQQRAPRTLRYYENDDAHLDQKTTPLKDVPPTTVSTTFSPPISPFLLKAPHCVYCNKQIQVHNDRDTKDYSELRLVLPDQESAVSEGQHPRET